MASTDDPWLTKLHAEWVGKVLYDDGYFRVVDILYVYSKGNNRHPCWEATSEPVYLHNGEFAVHDRNATIASDGTRITLKSSLVGFAHAEYSNGDEEDPVCLPFAAECYDRFLQRQARKARSHAMPTSPNAPQSAAPIGTAPPPSAASTSSAPLPTKKTSKDVLPLHVPVNAVAWSNYKRKGTVNEVPSRGG